MKIVMMESMYSGDIEGNTEFAQKVCRSLMLEGYNPFASHLFYTQFLDEHTPEERELGIGAGYDWGQHANIVFFCLQPHQEIEQSRGMTAALSRYRMLGKVTVLRRYDKNGQFISEEEI